MPLSYRDIYDIYGTQKEAGLITESMPEWSRRMNALTGTQEYAEGLRDSWWRRFSTAADEKFFEPIAEYSTEPIAGALGSLFGPGGEETGRKIGRGLPRTLLQTVPAIVGGILAAPETAGLSLAAIPAATGIGAGITGGLFGAQTYAETGSGKAALLSGAAAAALPGVGRFGESVATRLAGETWLPRFVGSQAGQVATLQAQQFAESKVLGTDYEPLSPEFWAQQIPFTVFEGLRASRAPAVKVTEAGEPSVRTTTRTEPSYEAVPHTEEESLYRDAALRKMTKVYTDPKATMRQKEESLVVAASAVQDIQNYVKQIKQAADQSPFDIPERPAERVAGRIQIPNGEVYESADAARQAGVTEDEISDAVAAPKGEDWRQSIEGANAELQRLAEQTAFVPQSAEELPDHLIQERIFRPAVKVVKHGETDGPVYVGYIHADAQGKAFQEGHDPSKQPIDVIHGFVTNKGRFLDRDQSGIEFGISQGEDMNPDEQPMTEEELKVQPWNIAQANETIYEPTKGIIEKAIRSGSTPTQAVEAVRLQQVTPKVDEAQQQRNILAKEDRPTQIQRRLANIENTRRQILSGQADIGQLPLFAGTAGKVTGEPIRLTTAAQERITALNAERDTLLSELSKMGPEIVTPEYQGREVLSRGKSLLKDSGERHYFENRGDAQKFLDQYSRDNPQDKTEWEVATRKQTKTKPRRYYLTERIGRKSVIEAAPGIEEADDFINKLQEDPVGVVTARGAEYADNLQKNVDTINAEPIAVEEQPDVRFDDMQRQLNVAGKNIQQFSNESGLDIPDSFTAIKRARVIFSELKEGRSSLTEINKALAKATVPGFVDEAHYKSTLRNIRAGLAGFSRTRNFSLGSVRPYDEALARQIGIREGGIRAALDWYAKRTDTGVMGDFLRLIRKASRVDESKVRVTFDQKAGWWRDPFSINVPHLPENEAAALDWGRNLAHEYSHEVLDDLVKINPATGTYVHTDPVSVRFRSSIKEVLKVLQNSPEIPAEIRKIFPKIRKWIADSALEKIAPADFVQRWDDAIGGTKGRHDEWIHVAYGLGHEVELVPSMFNSPKLVDLMQRTQMPAKPMTVLAHISQLWNRLFGGKVGTDTALSEILNRFDNYLSGPTLRPYKEGIVRVIPYNGRDFIRDSLVTGGVRPEALASRIDAIEGVFKSGSLMSSIEGYNRESAAGILPATTTKGTVHPEVTKVLTEGTPRDVKARVMGLLIDDVELHGDVFARLRTDLGVASDLYNAIIKRNLMGEVPPDALARIKLNQARLNAMQDAMEKQGKAISRFNDLSNFTYAGMERTLANGLSSDRVPSPPDPTELAQNALGNLGLREETERTAVSRAALEEGRVRAATKWVRNTFMLTQYLKGLVPEVRNFFNNIQRQQGAAFHRATDLGFVYNADPATKEISSTIRKANERVTIQPRLARAASDIRLWEQIKEREGTVPSLNDPFVKKILNRFNQADRQAIITERNSALHRHDHWVDQTVPQFLTELNMLKVARAITGREPGMRTGIGRELSQKMFDALNSLQDNPAGAQEALKQLSTRMSPETFLKTLDMARGLRDDSLNHIEFMKTRRHYVTEQRMKDHYVRMVTPDNEPWSASFDTKDSASKRVAALEKQGYKLLEYVPKEDLNVPGGVRQDVMAKLMELDEQHANKLKAAYADRPELLAALLPEVERAKEYGASKAAFSPVPGAGFPGRKFISGREELNMVENDHLFYNRSNNWMRHQLVRAESELDLLEPELLANRELTKLARQHSDNFLANDSQFARKMSEWTYNWKLAFNFGVNFLHAVQSLNTGMASLISETGKVGDALKLTTSAQKAITQRLIKGKWENPLHELLDRRASAEGIVGYTSWDSDIGDQSRQLMYEAQASPWGKVPNTLKWAARTWNGFFFRFNDRVGLISAFDHATKNGMDFEQAFQFARDVKERGYFTGGKAQRAVGQWSVKTKAVPQLMSSLQTYVQGWFSNLAYNYTRGFGRSPLELTAFERSAAKKAFLYQLGAQAVLAGALGLPGVGQGMALVKQTTGVDAMAWLRKNLSNFFQEDQDSGGMMTNLALHGAVAAFTPIDLSGRHMPSVPYIGVSPYKGFDVAQLAGAPVSGVSDLVKGVMAAAKGDVEGMSKLLPAALTGPYELYTGGLHDVRDRAGNLITERTPAEQFITALGMKPSRITQLKDVNAAAKESSSRASKERSEAIARIAKEFATDPTAARSKLLEYAHENPGLDYGSLVSTVAHHVADQTIPYDWRRHVNVGADILGLGSRQPSMEKARRSMIYSVQRSFGTLPKINPAADREAEDIDELLNTNPTMSRAQAVQQIRSVRPRPRSAIVEDADQSFQ